MPPGSPNTSPDATPRRVGRPSKFTEEIATTICDRLAGGESLRSICETEGLPDRNTVIRWILGNEDFYRQYARAREIQMEGWAEDIVEISDQVLIGKKTKTYPDGTTEVMTGDMIERARLKVDTRKWVMSKLAPKKYGEMHMLKHAGSDGGPMTVNLVLTPQALIPPPIEAKLITADESEDTE